MAVVAAERGLVTPQIGERIPSAPEIFVYGTGVDLAYPYPDGSRPRRYRYEDKSFRDVVAKFPRPLYTGPYSADTFFKPRLPTIMRSDAFGFILNPEGQLVLDWMGEFRTGALELWKKIYGFVPFVDEVRKQDYLTEYIETYFGDYVRAQIREYRPPVVVPEIGRISLTFVDPKERENTVIEDTPFRRVTFRRVPLT